MRIVPCAEQLAYLDSLTANTSLGPTSASASPPVGPVATPSIANTSAGPGPTFTLKQPILVHAQSTHPVPSQTWGKEERRRVLICAVLVGITLAAILVARTLFGF